MPAPLDDPFTRLVIERRGDHHVDVICKQSIAKRFGWDTAFEEWQLKARVDENGQRWVQIHPIGYGQNRYRGGTPIYISTSPKKSGHARGTTFRYRLIGGWSKKHQKQLAAVAGERFEWMENRKGQRVSREIWLA